MATLIAAGRFKFHGQWLSRGQVFEASDEEASELCAPSIGYATRVSSTPQPPEYDRADLAAVETQDSTHEPRGKRRRYARRDLRAKK